MHFVSEASKHAKLNEDLTKFVGRISLSAESLGKQFAFGRYGYLPYIGVRNMDTCPTSPAQINERPILCKKIYRTPPREWIQPE